MAVDHAKIWKCDFCPAEYTQVGPRAQSIPLIPPLGWYYVSVTKLIPAQGGVKDRLDDVRKVLCPKCEPRLYPLTKEWTPPKEVS